MDSDSIHSECLGRIMREAGHTLDLGCSLCAHNCNYAAPCACGSPTCLDLSVGAPRAGVVAAA